MAVAVQRSFADLGTPLHSVTFVVIDVETTGGSPNGANLTEVAAARYQGGELLGTYQTLVRPDERIPPFITALTGISDAMVADAPPVGTILPSLLEFVRDAVVVGHNIRFDLSFLDHALVATGRERLSASNASVDTLALARRLVRDGVRDCKLGTLSAALRLPHKPSHRALADVLATGDLLHALLERAGTFGITGLSELLELPRLVGHPQAGKLKLTNRLPRRPGVYWFTDSTGDVLYVGKAADLRSRVRSYFTGDGRQKVGRLLRQLDAVHHHVCPGSLTAEVIEGRLIRAWSPPFNRVGRVKRIAPLAADGTTPRRRRTRRSLPDPGVDPYALLAPYAARIVECSAACQFELAAEARDEAERLRSVLGRERRIDALARSGRVVLAVDDEGTIELQDGLLVGTGTMFDGATGFDSPVNPSPSSPSPSGLAAALVGDGHVAERTIVAQWLNAHAEKVRVVEAGGPGIDGLCSPAQRIPELVELCGPGVAAGTGAESARVPTAESA